jgi:hypothetical protein
MTGKGMWYQKKNQLILQPFDSIRAFPRVTAIHTQEVTDTTFYKINFKDYYGDPYPGIYVVLQSSVEGDSDLRSDSTGTINILKENGRYYAFYLRFKDANSDWYRIDSLKNYEFSEGVTGYTIHINYPSSVILDRSVILARMHRHNFRFKKDGLYHKKNKRYDLIK